MREQNALAHRAATIADLESQLDIAPGHLSGAYDVAPYGEGGLHLRDYWRSIRKRLWMIIGITLLITAAVAVYMARQPDIYAAQARVQVDLENNPGAGAVSKGGAVILNNATNDPNYFNTQLQILEGPGLLRRVVKTLDLENNREFRQPQIANRSTWQSLLRMIGLNGKERVVPTEPAPAMSLTPGSIAPPTSTEDPDEAERLAPYVSTLQRGLRIEQIKDTRLIDISYYHLDPAIATKIVNAVADIFVLSNMEKKTDTNSTEGDFLQKRIAEIQSQIRNGEERLVNYARNNQITSLDGSQNTVAERLVGLNQQLLQAENDRKQAEAAYQSALAPGAADALAKESANQAAAAESSLAALRQRRAQLLVKTTEEWPEVKEIDQQIIVLEKQIKDSRNQAVSVLLTNLKTRYQQALTREQSLRASFNQQRGETLTQNEAAINYRILQQEIETNKSLLDGLLQRSRENDVIVAGTANNIHVVDHAVKPQHPMGINRLFSVFLALPISLGLGIGLALFLDYLDDTLRDEKDVEKTLRLPTLTVIPSLQSLKRRGLLPAKYASRALAKNGVPNLLLINDSRSPLAEAYRQLRTSLLLSTIGGPPKTILVTSSLPSEGKTTTAINLAITLAQGGAEVLLIDGDMRCPRLHSVFDLENERGLSTIISSNGHADVVNDIIKQDTETGLNILAAGPMPPNPSDHLGSEKMRNLLKIFESTFTHVVIDSPPIASFTDGVLLSSMADNVLFVVRGGKSSRDIVKRARKLLQDIGANVTGVVLNNVPLRPHDRYYHQHYYDSAYYQTESDTRVITAGL